MMQPNAYPVRFSVDYPDRPLMTDIAQYNLRQVLAEAHDP